MPLSGGGPTALRAMNDSAALHALADQGPLSRIELERAVGLSKPAAAELLRRLEKAGLVRADGFRHTHSPGPNAQLWSLEEAYAHAVGADVTAQRIQVAVVDLAGRVVAELERAVTDSDPVDQLREAVHEVAGMAHQDPARLRTAVVGISGSIDSATGHLGYSGHLPRWHGFDVPQRLSAALQVPVQVENDVNLVITDQLRHGSAQGVRDVLMFWMDEGVAAALVLDGRLHRGASGSAGEVDMATLGGSGTIASLVDHDAVLALAAGSGLGGAEPADIVARATVTTDPAASRFLDVLAERIVESLVVPVALIDPTVVLLDGDVGQAGGQTLAERVRAGLHARLDHRPRVLPATARRRAVLHGAVEAALLRLRELVFSSTTAFGTGPPTTRSRTRTITQIPKGSAP